MNIYEELIDGVKNGNTFNINLKTRTMRVGNKYLVRDGTVNGKLPCIDNDVLDRIETLYHNYKVSLPSARNDSKRKHYFKAIPEMELTIDEMMVGEPREIAQAKLEGYILCQVLNGGFKWFEDNRWFYHGNDKDLIILKEWIVWEN